MITYGRPGTLWNIEMETPNGLWIVVEQAAELDWATEDLARWKDCHPGVEFRLMQLTMVIL